MQFKKKKETTKCRTKENYSFPFPNYSSVQNPRCCQQGCTHLMENVLQYRFSCTSLTSGSHLADSAMEAGLHMVFTLIARVDKAVLALVVQLHQHAHGTPLGPPQ